MAEQIGESKYSKKFAQRRSADNGAVNPKPRPLHTDYFPKRGTKYSNYMVHYVPLPFEKPVKEPVIKEIKKAFEKLVKFDHYKMNYSGWDSV